MRTGWKQLDPLQQGLLIGLVLGVLPAVLDRDPLWIAATLAAGTVTGNVVSRRRQRARAREHASSTGAPVTRQQRRQDKVDQREFRLRAASSYQGRELLYRGADRSTALERVRAKVPGFADERYEAALSDAVAQLERLRRHSLERRAKNIAEARLQDVLNAVFALHYLNGRFHGQNIDDGIVPIHLHEVLGDLWSAEEIEAALARSATLIEDGMRYGWQPDQTGQHLDELATRHPGFNLPNLHAALAWGYQRNR